MVKISFLALPLVAIGSAAAFVPSAVSSSRAFVPATSSLRMADVQDAETVTPSTPPAPAPAPKRAPSPAPSPGGKLVPIKEETVQFTAGLVGGVAGFAIGGPVLGAIGAALANYASKNDDDVGEVVSAVSKSSIEVYNYLSKLDEKYELLNKSKESLEDALDKLKRNDKVDPATIDKVESALDNTSSKIKEINEEYDLVGAGQTALGVIGDLVEKAIKKAGELNEEYKLTDKAQDAIKGAVDKAKDANKNN